MGLTLSELALLLAAAAIAAPIAKLARIGTILGYLLAGVALGPYGVQSVFSSAEASEMLHFAEFGIVLLLFLIGLELRPKRLVAMRNAIFGLGGAQVAASALVMAVLGVLLGLKLAAALFAGLALALSSTAFALQVLEEKGELTARHGRLAFAVLLFQDLAAIPLIALVPFFAVEAAAKPGMDLLAAGKALATIIAVVLVGHFLLDRVFRLVAATRVKEATTALALLVVVLITIVMHEAGLSPALGAFIAGALLAESSYRHQIEADIQPFEGLLLGLFFTAVGMSLNLGLLTSRPMAIIGFVAALVAIKTAVLYALGRWQGLAPAAARRLGLSLSQGGEFAFVLLAAGVTYGVLSRSQSEFLIVVVTLSMAATPLLLLLDDGLRRLEPARATAGLVERPPANEGHVIIAGFGRFGQIVARVLRAKKIPFTALDISPEQIALVERFGSKAFYGDASRLDILEAAQADKARAFVLAIDDVEASIRTAEMVKARFPDLPIYARTRNRNHSHRLLDAGVKIVRRETFLSALDITRSLLRGLGLPEREIERTITTFQSHDERRLIADYQHYTDMQKIQELARSDAANLEKLFAEDALEEAKVTEATPVKGPAR
jgi:monovalent cation:proton antiporter-2 (CPA2) family protein